MEQLEENIRELFGSGAGGNTAVVVFRILLALLIFWIGTRIIRWICKVLQRGVSQSNADPSLLKFLNTVVKIVLYLVLILLILNGFGINASSLLAVLGSVGLAIVLSVKESLSNVASGVMILILKPFSVNDYIIEHTNNTEGTVMVIDLFYTKLLTIDGSVVVLPNSMLTGNSITNLTTEKQRILDLSFPVAYGDDVERAKKLLLTVLREDPSCALPDQAQAFVKELGDQAVTLGGRLKVPTEDYWPTRYRVLENVQACFRKEKIAIGYPQVEVRMKQAEGKQL